MPTLPPERSTGFLWRWCTAARNFMASMIIRPSADITPEYVGPFGVLLHLTRRAVSPKPPKELDVTIDETDIIVTGAEFVRGEDFPAITYAGNTVDGETVDSVAVAEDDERWVYVEVSINGGTATAKLTADASKPKSSASTGVMKIPLSKWKRTATSWTHIVDARAEMAQHGVIGM